MKKKISITALAIITLLGTVSFQSDFFEIAKQVEIFTTLFKEVNMNYVDETNPAQLMDAAIEGMLDELDPYTKFWTEQEVEDAKINRSGEYSGIGARVRNGKNKLTILEPRKGYPADNAGLKAGDEIIQIDDILIKDFEGETGDLLKGSSGTKIEVTYLRQGKKNTTTITRSKVDIKAVPFYKLIDNNVGYIVLTTFNAKAAAQVKEALLDLKGQGAEKIILDLRNNGGGLLTQAISICNLFLPKDKVITTTKSVVKKFNSVYKTKTNPVDTEIPLAVLVNGRSASASEIVSGGLQDYDRAVVIGVRSFGKGLVQRPKPLTYGTQAKITISRYYTPSGRCIQALDYWNRDSKGNAVRTDKKDYKEFKTANGRPVFDGGGVEPDIKIASANRSAVTGALVKANAIFDFATKFYYANNFSDTAQFSFDDNDFKDFKKYLKSTGFDYETQTEKAFEKAFSQAEKDKLNTAIKNSFEALKTSITKAKEDAVNESKQEIINLLEDEIVKRYFYRDGLYEYQIVNNEVIAAAVNVLNDTAKYNSILK